MDKLEKTNGGNTRALSIEHNDAATGLRVLQLLDDKQLVAAENFIKRVMGSPKSGISNVQEGLAVLMRANDLQLPFSSCLEHIHVINGKTGVDIHIIKSLLSRAGVTWECTKDYAPQYQYTDGNTIYLETQLPQYCVRCRTANEAEEFTKTNKDEKVGVYPVKWYKDLANRIYNEFQVSAQCVEAINKAHAEKLKADGKFPIIRIPAQPIDFVTEYTFTRYVKNLGGIVKQTAISHFSLTEAQAAGFFEKETYKKYARVMIGHRAFTLGARDIASDVIQGVMETSEQVLVEGDDYTLLNEDYLEETNTSQD